MSTGELSPGSQERADTELMAEFLDEYYRHELQEIASGKRGNKTLYVDAADLQLFLDSDDFEYFTKNLTEANEYLSEAPKYADATQGLVDEINATVIDPTGATIEHIGVSEIGSHVVGEYVGVKGQLTAVSKIRSFPWAARWKCNRCGAETETYPTTREFEEPGNVCECERNAKWKLAYEDSAWIDHRKLKIQQPPEKAANGETQHIVAHVFGEATNDRNGTPLVERAGEDVVVYGQLKLRQQEGRNSADYLFNHYLSADAVTFEDGGLEAVEIEKHKDEIEDHASADDVYERFYTSLAPQIHPTPQLELAMKVCAAYLFAAPRVDPDDGPMYRGDIHAAIFGDPGMAKSVLLDGVAEFSPEREHRSATGLSSDVGLVAAAVDDDFGEGGWTLKPGILVRAGMHAIIDEIDKGPDDLEKINDALEGRQIATVDKGGIKADLKTRTGLLASGNPKEGRFSKHEPLPAQVDVDETLLTRFDAIVLLQDNPDEEQDRAIANHITNSFMEGVDMIREDGNPDIDTTKRVVDPEVGRAWVAMGREIIPRITDEAAEQLEEYYVDARTINADMEDDETFSATARQLEGGIRFAMAFARMRLSETVEQQDVEMAIDVSRALIGQTHDPEEGTFDIDYLTTTGDSTRSKLRDALDTKTWMYPDEIARETKLGEEKVRDALIRARKGKMSLPVEEDSGKWRLA